MKEKKSFVVYYEWEEMLNYMSDSQIAEIFKGMFEYAKTGTVPQFENPLLNSTFCIMKYAIDRDAENYKKRSEKNTENANKRWHKNEESGKKKMQSHTKDADNDNDNVNDNDNDNDNVNDNDNNKESTSSSTALTERGTKKSYSDDFLNFWQHYPKKVGKGAAYKAYLRLKLSDEDKKAISHSLNWQIKSDQWQRNGGQFIPHPATYLSQRRWEDEPEEPFCGDITDPKKYVDDAEDYFDFRGAYG